MISGSMPALRMKASTLRDVPQAVTVVTRELMRDLGRPRGDMWEVAIWEDLVTVTGAEGGRIVLEGGESAGLRGCHRNDVGS